MTRVTAGRLPLALGAGALALYGATAAPTITFWDGAHYPLLAITLGISNPPGSLLLTLLGWTWTRLAWASSPAFQLNLLSALVGACTVALAARVAMRTAAGSEDRPASLLAAFAAGGWLASSYHLWNYATQFTPYGLTAAFTALLLLLFVRWWDHAAGGDDAPGLAAVALVLGLDVSVHRTNQLLLPALVAGVLLRRPRALLRPRAVGLVLGSYVLGALSQLGYLALSARQPFLDMQEMRTASDVWHFFRLDPLGGGFLMQVWPRRADFWHVQFLDWVSVLSRSLGALPVTRLAALALAGCGVLVLTRRSPRLAVFLVVCFLASGLGAVLYFNRPAQYMRPLDRHYMPSLVVLAVFVGAGAAGAAGLAARSSSRLVRLAPALAVAALVGVDLAANWARCDRSHTRFAETWARDLLEPLPPRAILFTNGDNDTFPLWYLQQAEHVRPDVRVLNLAVLCAPAPVRALARREPEFRHVEPGLHAMRDVMAANGQRRPVYAAVTLAPDWEPGLRTHARLEGLANRLDTSADTVASDSALERFVTERLPRLGLGDRRQLLEPEMQPMLANYGYVGLALAGRQLETGRAARAAETLRALELQLPPQELGEAGEALATRLATMRRAAETAVARARARDRR